jgi:hypothetical protein
MPDVETPEEDAVEQQQTVTDPEDVVPGSRTEAPLEVDEGDLVESTLEVPLDEDDWR